MMLRARSVIAPASGAAPVAVPEYVPFVIVIVLPSVVVHDFVVTLPAFAANVPATVVAVFAPSIPCATATLVTPSATRPTIARNTLRIESSDCWLERQTLSEPDAEPAIGR